MYLGVGRKGVEGVSAETRVSDLSNGTLVGVVIRQTERRGKLRGDDGFRFKQSALEILTSPGDSLKRETRS